MNPYLVISSNKDKADGELYETWVRIFSDINNTFEIDQEKFNFLTNRLGRAYTICSRRDRTKESYSDEEDSKEYSALSYLEKEENNSFNGDYPFFNDEDMELAYKVFSLREIALIQLGEYDLVACGKKEEFNYRPQIRKGLLYEIKKDYYNAYKCYERIPENCIKVRYDNCKRIVENQQNDLLVKAKGYFEDKKYEEALSIVKTLVEQGFERAKTLLGILLARGLGVKANVQEGFDLLYSEAVLDSIDAKKEIINLYDEGIIRGYIDEDEIETICRDAIRTKDPFFAQRVEKGFNDESKREALQKLMKEGNVNALWLLGKLLVDEGDEEGTSLIIESSDKGNVDASLYLAKTCEQIYSKEVAKDYYELAAKQGSLEAIKWLGENALFYASIPFYQADGFINEKVKAEHIKQYEAYLQCAKKGDSDAMMKVGIALINGYPVMKNIDEALTFLLKADSLGNTKASYYLGQIYEGMAKTTEDKLESLNWYEKGAKQGDALAISRLYTSYLHGDALVNKNIKKANKYMYMLHNED
ncbi:MAG: hypothetical protein ACI4U5_02970 [Bacilli bacterium]